MPEHPQILQDSAQWNIWQGIADYLKYIKQVRESLLLQDAEITQLCRAIAESPAVHIYGFGRSGAAALALAIRLRHYQDTLPPVWWVGDQVRNPMHQNDLVILVSREGSRGEVASVAYQAISAGAIIALISTRCDSRIHSLARIKILLPASGLAWVYDGGDFDFAAFFFQELLATQIGRKKSVRNEDVARNNV